jgi:hypothetical protein
VTLARAVEPFVPLELEDGVGDEAAIPAVQRGVDVAVRLLENAPVRRRERAVSVKRSGVGHGQIHVG